MRHVCFDRRRILNWISRYSLWDAKQIQVSQDSALCCTKYLRIWDSQSATIMFEINQMKSKHTVTPKGIKSNILYVSISDNT
jgi:hypothetical protein